MNAIQPPRLTRALLRHALPADVRDGISGDLEERLQRDRSRWRYRRHAWALIARFAVDRSRHAGAELMRLRFSHLDVRLGVRMLARYPGLSLVGGLALAMAIALGAAVFSFMTVLLFPSISLPNIESAVTVRLYDAAANTPDPHASFDFLQWRHEAKSVTALSASRTLSRNLTTPDGRSDSVAFAEVTASLFDFLQVAPVKGRFLSAEDERIGAPEAVVISHALWQSRFGGAADAIGARVTVGDMPATVVGIMPGGLKFPSIQDAWVPLRWSGPMPEPRGGADIRVWARLADGATLAQAQAEFAALATRRRAEFPREYEHVQNHVLTLVQAARPSGPETFVLPAGNFFVAMLLVLVSGNVALLMFARAATRESEILVRTALGASRGRIILQFFTEALVLGGISAAIGLWIAKRGLEWAMQLFAVGANEGVPLPFWMVPRIQPLSIAYTVCLTLLAAFVAGVLPALRVTRALDGRLRETSSRGGGLRFGGIWTAVIVTQIALTVTFPVTAFFVKRNGAQVERADIGVPPERILHAEFQADRDQTQQAFDTSVERIRDAVRQIPGVRDASLATWLPLMSHDLSRVEIEGDVPAPVDSEAGLVSHAEVDRAFFGTFDAAPASGRLFTAADALHPQQFVIVNASFVQRVLGGRNPIGRRLRLISGSQRDRGAIAAAPWRQVIGVVRDLGMGFDPSTATAGVYSPLALGARRSYTLAARVEGDPQSLAPTLRALARDISPATRVVSADALRSVTDSEIASVTFFYRMTVGLSAAALALSLTGIYAVMSFTVARRTPEIGIRMALGSRPAQVVLAILRTPMRQVAAGVLAGGCLTGVLVWFIYDRTLSWSQIAVVCGYVVLMFGVCLLACVVPTRRAMKVDPLEALRAE